MQTIKTVVIGDPLSVRSVKDDTAVASVKTALLITYTTKKFPVEYVPTVSVCREDKTLHWLLSS